MDEIEDARYFLIIVDATPDLSHVEKSTFIIRYLTQVEVEVEVEEYSRKEQFLTFVDCCQKTGAQIYGIPTLPKFSRVFLLKMLLVFSKYCVLFFKYSG